jgi:hypothetical protein
MYKGFYQKELPINFYVINPQEDVIQEDQEGS